MIKSNFLENMKQGFKRISSWNRSDITTQTKNNLDYLIDSTFRNINRLFVRSFKNGNDDLTKDSFAQCYMPLVEIIAFNEFINKKPFSASKNQNEKRMKKLFKCQEMMTIQQEFY